MEKKNNAVVKKVIIAVVAVVLLVAAIFLTKTFIDNKNEPSNGDVPSSSQTQTTEPVAKPDYSEYVEQNPETVGWITIPGTQINFPVVQSVDNEYYLSHTFNHKSDKRGAIYMDYRNNPVNLDANTIIYGHNSYDGKVFSDLAQYDDIDPKLHLTALKKNEYNLYKHNFSIHVRKQHLLRYSYKLLFLCKDQLYKQFHLRKMHPLLMLEL